MGRHRVSAKFPPVLFFFSMEEMSFNELHIVKFQWFYGISRERVKCSNLSCSRFSNLLKYKWKSYMLIVN
jgi:hypothetical protein